jgi:hypothetical protein
MNTRAYIPAMKRLQLTPPYARSMHYCVRPLSPYIKCRFYLVDGGNNTEFAAAVRLRSGTGASLREWPIKEGCCFSVGNSVFHCTRQQPPAAVDAAADSSAAATTAAGSTASDTKPAQDAGGAKYVLFLHVSLLDRILFCTL